MKKTLILMLPLVLIFAGCQAGKKTQEQRREPVPIKIGKVKQVHDHEIITASGTVTSPDAPSSLAFLVSGKVMRVGPREGDYVKKGAVLAVIDQMDYSLSVQAAAAQAALSQASLDKAKNPARPEQLEQTRISYERSEDEYRRMKMLYDSKSLAPNDFLKYKAAYDSAKQQYEQAKFGGQKEDKDQAKAAFEQAAAHERMARKQLSDATLRAPFDGYISKRDVEPGDMAAAGRPVFEMVRLDPVEVSVGIPETDVVMVKPGQKVEIEVPALPHEIFMGVVRVVNVSADPASRTYLTKIAVANPKRRLLVGMVAEARIIGDKMVDIATLPADAIVRDPQGALMVYVYYPDQKRAYAKRVNVGAVYGKEIEIKSGLAGDELVVLAGQPRSNRADC
jgi:RND family efflux transporter MFP subunit